MAGEYAPNVEGTWIGGGGDAMGTFVPSAPGEYVDIGGGGDQSNVVFVPDYVPQAPQPAPGWLAPPDYVAAGYTSTGQPTPESIKAYENAVASQDIVLQQTGLMRTGVEPFGIRKAPDWLPKGSYNLLGYDSAGNKTGDPLLDVPQNMAAKVMAAYQNILGRNATQAELVHHVDVFSKKPDDYQWWLGSLSESPESIQRVATGQTNWDTVEKNARLLSQGYGFWTPTEESWWQKATNTVGSAIPYAALGAMTGGAGYAAGLGGTTAGVLGGGVTGAARAGMEGGNIPKSALIGAITAAVTGNVLGNIPSLDFGLQGVTPAYGLNLDNVISNAGTSFINNLGPGLLNPFLNLGTGNNAVPNGGSSFTNNLSLEQAGPTYSQLGYTPQAGPTNFELGYNPSGSTNPSYGFTGNNTLSSTFTQSNQIGPFDLMRPGDVQVSSVDPNSYFIKNADQTLSAVTPAGTIQVPVGSENLILKQASDVLPIDWTKGDQYIPDAGSRAAEIQNLTRPIPLGTPNEPYGSGNFLGNNQATDITGANFDQPYMQQIADKTSNDLPYSSAIQEGTTFYTDPITGQQIPVELAVPQATTSTVSGTGTEGVAQTYVSGSNEYVGLPDGTFIKSNVETGVETIVDSLPKDAVLVNAGDGVSPINGANTFASLTTGEILSGAGGAAALAALLNSLGVGSGGPGAGANGAGPGTGGGGTGTGGGGTGTGVGGTGTGTGGTGTGGTGTGKGGGGVPKVPVPSALPKLLKNPVLYQSAPGGLYRGNQNPFTFGKDVPIQNPFENYDPFAALNVPQLVPKSDADLLANLLREHIYG